MQCACVDTQHVSAAPLLLLTMMMPPPLLLLMMTNDGAGAATGADMMMLLLLLVMCARLLTQVAAQGHQLQLIGAGVVRPARAGDGAVAIGSCEGEVRGGGDSSVSLSVFEGFLSRLCVRACVCVETGTAACRKRGAHQRIAKRKSKQ